MTDAEWEIVLKIHLRGTYAVCHAAWPIFQKQKYGRIITTTSAVGVSSFPSPLRIIAS